MLPASISGRCSLTTPCHSKLRTRLPTIATTQATTWFCEKRTWQRQMRSDNMVESTLEDNQLPRENAFSFTKHSHHLCRHIAALYPKWPEALFQFKTTPKSSKFLPAQKCHSLCSSAHKLRSRLSANSLVFSYSHAARCPMHEHVTSHQFATGLGQEALRFRQLTIVNPPNSGLISRAL